MGIHINSKVAVRLGVDPTNSTASDESLPDRARIIVAKATANYKTPGKNASREIRDKSR